MHRGGGKKARLLECRSTAPELLHPTLYDAAALRRLERLAAAVRYPSIKAPARALGIDPHGIGATQIRRLEHDLGGQVLIRGKYDRAMTLTDLGKQVVDAFRMIHKATRPVSGRSAEEMPRV